MNRKIIIYILIIVIVLALFGAGIFLIIKKPINNSAGINSGINNINSKPIPTPIPFKRLTTAEDKEKCPKTKDEAGCLKLGYYAWSQANFNEILSEKDMKRCKELELKNKESCLYHIAVVDKKIELCEGLSNEDTCKLEIVKGQNDWNACNTLTDASSKELCQKNYVLLKKAEGDVLCNAVPKEDKQLCLNYYFYSIAVGKFDYVSCRKIIDKKMLDECLSVMPADSDGDDISNFSENNVYYTDSNKKDTDGDGLSDYDEIFKYKTDPLKPDTDGDGYNDGEEVRSNHNPLGR